MWTLAASSALLLLLESSSARANPAGFYERPASTSQRTGMDGEAARLGPLEDPSPSKLNRNRPQVSLNVVLPQVSEAERASLEPDRGGPPQIGFGRAVPAEYLGDLAARLEWSSGSETEADGSPVVAALTVTSPEAAALRIGLRAKLAAGATLRFSGLSDPEQAFRPFTHEDFGSSADVVWSPVVEGDTVRLDIGLPSPEALPTFSLFLHRVSHIVAQRDRSAADSSLDVDE